MNTDSTDITLFCNVNDTKRSQVQGSGLALFISGYKSRPHCFHKPRFDILLQSYFHSVSFSAKEALVPMGSESEPIDLEPSNGYQDSYSQLASAGK